MTLSSPAVPHGGPVRLTGSANDVAHVFLVDVQSDKHAHLIAGALTLDVIRVVDESFNNVLHEILVLHSAAHVVFQNMSTTSTVDF